MYFECSGYARRNAWDSKMLNHQCLKHWKWHDVQLRKIYSRCEGAYFQKKNTAQMPLCVSAIDLCGDVISALSGGSACVCVGCRWSLNNLYMCTLYINNRENFASLSFPWYNKNNLQTFLSSYRSSKVWQLHSYTFLFFYKGFRLSPTISLFISNI